MADTQIAVTRKKAEEAFGAVLLVGRSFAEQIAQARDAGDPVAEAVSRSFGMVDLQDAIEAHPEAYLAITRGMGKKWGFKTDQDWTKDGYDKGIVIGCFCEAILDGLLPVGNEFNIIQSSMYVTKEGWRGKLDRLPGVSGIDSRPGVISDAQVREFQTKKGDTKFKMTATIAATADCYVWGQFVQVTAWDENGHDERLQISASAEFADEVIDQIKGKADARMLERLYWKCKGISKNGAIDAPAGQQVPKTIAMHPVEQPRKLDTQPAKVDNSALPFDKQIEAATKSRELDTIARAIVAAKLSTEETEWLKAMVKTARERLKEAGES